MTTRKEGEIFRLESYKHDGMLHRQWEENLILHWSEDVLIGINDRTKVIEPNQKTWITTEPGLFYFHKDVWFNVVRVFNEQKPYYYCNMSSPFTYKNGVLTYIDYDLDLIVYDDESYKLLDEDEYYINKQKLSYGKEVEDTLTKHLSKLKSWMRRNEGPFEKGFVDYWYSYYLTHYTKH